MYSHLIFVLITAVSARAGPYNENSPFFKNSPRILAHLGPKQRVEGVGMHQK